MNITYKNFQDIPVWQASHLFVLKIYKITERFPKRETYSLCDQIRRAVVSCPANIVEGHNRKTTKERIQFLYTAKGSISEVQYFLILSKDLGYISLEEFELLSSEADSLAKQLGGWIKYLQNYKN